MNETLSYGLSVGFFAYGMMIVIAGLCAVLIRVIVTVLAKTSKAPAKASSKAPAPAAPKPAAAARAAPAVPVPGSAVDDGVIVAVITAAVHAALGAGHRIVHLEEASHSAWTRDIRARHHTSHSPHR
ncbi:hypothetical protein A33M_0051 [Rhodovulum sp. PH10]|uniref:OadG family transporter subunit n=1 Tax=Rhodovulum sp. PH10 TaxID=1187851 RepID=UPI00027C25B8|nr:OadG family transporter subunit [Rhodovulum sp. PH10]EJW13721.1 hypothetical protein A33M_0051 [Rhodovulum sp. PH10]